MERRRPTPKLVRILVSTLLAVSGALVPLVLATSPASASTVIAITDQASCEAQGGTVVGGCRFYIELTIPAGTTLTSTMELQFCRDVLNDGTISLASGVGLLQACGTFTNNGTITMSNATLEVYDSQAAFTNSGTITGCNLTVVGTIGGTAPADTCPTITDEASCEAQGGTVVGGCRFYIELTIPAGTTLSSTMELQFCRDVLNDGTISLASGVDLLQACGTFTNNGTVVMSNATLEVYDSQAAFINNGAINACNVAVVGTVSGNTLTDTCPDTSAPTTTITVPTPDGANGWFVSAPTITVSADDASGSGVAETRCVLDPAVAPTSYADLPTAPCNYLGVGAAVTGEGEHTLYAASVDVDGNEESPVSAAFKIDTVDPALAPTVSPTAVYLNAAGVTAAANATDDGSGVDESSVSCDAVDTSAVGAGSVSCSASDLAGNSATASATFTVWYALTGFASPATDSKWKAGQTVPVKLVLADADGVRISDEDAAALAASCSVKFSATGVQTLAASCMKYNADTDQFLFTWKLKKSPTGAETITATVSYGSGTVPNTLSTSIVITR